MSSEGNNSHDRVGQVSQNTYIQRMHSDLHTKNTTTQVYIPKQY